MPPRAVLEAFETDGEPVLLPGGTGRTWRAGGLVLKPLDRAPAEIAWQADVLARIQEDGFRVTRPLPRIVDGWTAWYYVEGRHEPRRWLDIIAVGERFHAALAGVPRPSAIIDAGVEPWATGDRVTWGDERVEGLDDILAALRPVAEPSGLIHGDLTGNVLFDEELPPAIIDFTPYWRPLQFASAIVVADALIWEDARPELADAVDPQYLLRALIYRGVTSMVAGTDWRPTIALARRIAAQCASH
jgi:Phosphotransferase enzyme family